MKDPVAEFYAEYDWFHKKPKLKGQNMKKETLQKIIDTLNVLVIPVSTVIAIWSSFDVSVYVAGGVAAVNGVLEYLKLFCKE
ncbi:MAG: hypothetical protein IKT32_04775 [Clostridia bacterium]|nr:hypothetical protein [Clostridia bacterium]